MPVPTVNIPEAATETDGVNETGEISTTDASYLTSEVEIPADGKTSEAKLVAESVDFLGLHNIPDIPVAPNNYELKYMRMCADLGVSYIPPDTDESARQKYNRGRRMKHQCDRAGMVDKRKSRKRKSVQDQVSDTDVDFTVHPIDDHVTPMKISRPKQSKDGDEVISSDQLLNSNPSLSKAIHAFETGEMLHTVGTCIICLETRPVFHCVDNKAKVKIEPWKLSKKGVCKRCADDQRKKCEVPLFSGCRSVEEHLGPKTHELRHNNMHFEDVPPFLQNLTALESSLV